MAGGKEFIAMMAGLAALDAFSIDAMMPALELISQDLGIVVENHRQYIITAIFLGFSIGVLIYGFVSDQLGRRGPLIAGVAIFIVASLICIFCKSLGWLLAGRVLQGVGAAGPYVISIAIVRDRFEGREMARIMSLIMMVFIGVPMIAPFVGQGILLAIGWRSIFTALAVYGVCVGLWFWLRQPETLLATKRQHMNMQQIVTITKEILCNRQTLFHLICLSAISGSFIAYLSTAQQVFQNIYTLGNYLPLAIACLASAYGIACYTNSHFVETLGMRQIVNAALLAVVANSTVYSLLILASPSLPSIWVHFFFMGVSIFFFGFLFQNIMTLALEPMSHIAGSATSVITSISTLASIALAAVIGSLLNQSVLPVTIGFAVLGAVGWFFHRRAVHS